jgi:hypothetical protein
MRYALACVVARFSPKKLALENITLHLKGKKKIASAFSGLAHASASKTCK